MKILMPLFVVAALVGSQAAIAAPTAKATTAVKTTVVTTKPVATTKSVATQTKTVAKTRTVKAARTGGRMVTTKTSTGKTITYDCSKAGNATKAACK
jgi:hypothetical protein